ncbi:MAG: ATP-binding cassette domain-containing protein, partial [Deltaproteobacteria bacterium]|nr:ATP-binding cassette domain-containing protein [Deltaproteobacteria bacterium]
MPKPNDITPPDKAKPVRPKVVAHESQTPENRLIEAINQEILSRENMRLKAPQAANVTVPKAPPLAVPLASALEAPLAPPRAMRPATEPLWPEAPRTDALAGGLPWDFSEARPLEPRLEPTEMVKVENLAKTFVLHLSGPAVLKALEGVSLSLTGGKCLALTGPSGSGKSSLLRCLYGNYQITSGEILIRDGERIVALSQATPREVMDLRLRAMSYVSQFLRVIPRVSALEVVAEPLTARGL